MELICYGCDDYLPERFNPIENKPFWHKPLGGLWTSPLNSKYGWRDWCEAENFGNLSRYFVLYFSGRILTINSQSDLIEYASISCKFKTEQVYLDFEELSTRFDAIHLTEDGQWRTRHPDSGPDLYGWDCETVLILNEGSIHKEQGE